MNEYMTFTHYMSGTILSTIRVYLIFTMIPKRIIFSLYIRYDRLYFPNMAITICLTQYCLT